ncbi:HNH endonuclease signature motif containing protein [Duganella sp. BJB476]|uniref:HNH endonuclease n=1 Tax=Duganella sp. BJB476 TaxID=1871176 RepID=UPI000E34B167|nr:HNH endonuclease signature motif containing protein [Duganella sp. BJB476]RFP29804.1 HNH endonuclease [Duganella sp. BJB476]
MTIRDWQPEQVQKKHVKQAAKIWRTKSGYLNFKNSTKYDVIVGGKPYPPKAISSIAHNLATGKILYANDFVGSKEGVWHRRLKILGFEILEKNTAQKFDDEISASLKLTRQARLKKIVATSTNPPKKSQVQVTRYARSPHVVAERLIIANGKCEKCRKTAPFKRKRDNTPYLEVHHVKLLSQGGLDTIENTLALCPNCHCELHDILRIDNLVE